MPTKQVREEQDLDIWAKLAQVPEAERGNYRVEITRLSPEHDDETGERLAGFLRELQLADFTRDYIPRFYGGGVYLVQVRDRKTGMFFCQETLTYAGPSKRAAAVFAPAAAGNTPEISSVSHAGIPGGFDQGYRQAMLDAAEQKRRDDEAADRRAMLDTLGKIQERLAGGNGSGNGHSVLDTVKVLAEAVNLLGVKGNGQGLDTLALIKLLEDRENRGEQRAEKFLQFMRDSGVEPESMVESKALDMLGEFIKLGRQEKLAEKTAVAMRQSPQPAVDMFKTIRDGLGDIIAKHFGPIGASAAMLIRGSRSDSELLMAVDQVVQQMADMAANREEEEEQEEDDGSADTEQGPEDKPGDKPGSKDS